MHGVHRQSGQWPSARNAGHLGDVRYPRGCAYTVQHKKTGFSVKFVFCLCASLLLPCSLSCSCSSSSSAGGSGAFFTQCRDTWQPGGSRFSVQNCLNFEMKTCGGVLVYSTVICSIRYYMYMKLVNVVYTGSSMSCLQFVHRGSCCHNLSAAHKKCYTACATCSGLIRPLVLVCIHAHGRPVGLLPERC